MRAYPFVQVSLAIAFLIAACLVGTLACPQDAMAREPEYEPVIDHRSGGTGGGGEWRTPPDDPPQLSIDVDERPGGGVKTYSEPRKSADAGSWVENMNSAIVRMVRFVGAKYSELF